MLRPAFLALPIAFFLCQSGRSGNFAPTVSSSIRSSLSSPEVNELRNSFARRDYEGVIGKGRAFLRSAPALNPYTQVRIRSAVGAAQAVQSKYRDALRTLVPARDLARARADHQALVPICNSIAWIYLKMDNLPLAAEYADEALAAQSFSGKYDVRLVILQSLIAAKRGDFAHSDISFREAIDYSLNAGDIASAASAWYSMGRGYALAHRGAQAQAALTESFRLRKLHHLPDLEVSMRDLAEVMAEQGDLRTSTVLLDEAVAAMGSPASSADTWGFLLDRGRLRLMKGDLASALQDLRNSLALARRLDVIPTDDDRVTFESGLADLYSLFIDCGNRLYLQNHDQALKDEIFEAAEENRAASLRALVPQPNGWRLRLAPEHDAVLKQLQDAERNLLVNPGVAAESQVRQLRTALDRIESRADSSDDAGAPFALNAARSALTPDTAILSFHLGPHASWAWVITETDFEVYRLPSKGELAADARPFVAAVRGTAEASVPAHYPSDLPGDVLGRKLVGQFPPAIHAKRRWVVALDQELLEIPLAALRWQGRYLGEDHSLLTTPGVRLLKPAASESFQGRLLAVGDPIYNRADPRWQSSARLDWRPFSPPERWHLARLAASAQEVRTALESWGNGKTLTGADGNKQNFLRISQEQPTIIHLATHVIRAAGDNRAGIIVLGLDLHGEPEFLDMREIAQQSLHAKLVVMSGCASGDARALPANGLMGLTRAWLGSGVEDVLATRWPSLDDNGPFFASFYNHLRSNPRNGAAGALQQARVDMLHSHTFRANPGYWASYFLIGTV